MWFQELRGFEGIVVECLFINTPKEMCIQRVLERRNHPTLKGDGSQAVIEDFARGLEPPTPHEGFSAIHIANTPEEVRGVLRMISSYPVLLKDA